MSATALRVAAAAWVLSAFTAPAHAQFELDQPAPFDSATTTGTFANGLRYYVRVNHEPHARAQLRLAVRAGSTLEDDDQRGLAHFVEHMAFNGTRDFKANELVDYMQRIGMRFGADVNAHTSFDETVYELMVPTDDDSTFDTGFRILENWAHALSFDPAEIEKERGVVIEEWRSGRGAQQRIRDRQLPVLLNGSRYADRLPIGDPEILRHCDPAALQRYYRDWYRPDLMAVIAVGDFDPVRVEAMIRKYFATLPAAAAPRPWTSYPVPLQPGTTFAIAQDKEATTSSVGVYTKFDRRENTSVGSLRRHLVENLFSNMLNNRFDELTRKPDPPYVNAFAGRSSFVRPQESYVLAAAVRSDAIERGFEALLLETQRAILFGFTPGELERAKKRFLSYAEREYAERDKSDSDEWTEELLGHFLAGSPSLSADYWFAVQKTFLPEIQLEEINVLAKQWNVDRNRTVLASGPDKDGVTMPDQVALAAILERASTAKLEPYVDTVADAQLVATLPTPGTVRSEKRFPDLDIVLWTLSNGARVYLKKTDFKDDEILFRAWSPGGSSLASDPDYFTATLAAAAVSAGGLGPFNATDLQKYLSGKQAAVFPLVGEFSEGFNGQARPEDLETMLQLLYGYFTAPRSDPIAFDAFRTRYRKNLEDRIGDPGAAFQDSLNAVLWQHHPRVRPMTPQDLDAVDLRAAMQFFHERFSDADDFTFIVVGNIDFDTIRPLVLRYIGGLQPLPRRDQWRDTGRTPPPHVVERTFRKGVDPKARTSIVFTGPFEWSNRQSYALSCLAEAMNIRLRKVIREEKGGTYGVSVNGFGTRAAQAPVPFSGRFPM